MGLQIVLVITGCILLLFVIKTPNLRGHFFAQLVLAIWPALFLFSMGKVLFAVILVVLILVFFLAIKYQLGNRDRR